MCDDNEVVFEIINGDDPREIARRVCSIVVGNRDTWEKNDHSWFFGENNEWVIVRMTATKYTLRGMDGFATGQQEALKTVIEWLVNGVPKPTYVYPFHTAPLNGEQVEV